MQKQIFYHDTDAGGVVYYGNYLKYLEEARTEFLLNKGIEIKLFKEQTFLYAVRKCAITYHAPARYGDIIVADAILRAMSAAQLVFEQSVKIKADDKLLVKADVTLVSLNKDFKPT